jgi:hypothetical protein
MRWERVIKMVKAPHHTYRRRLVRSARMWRIASLPQSVASSSIGDPVEAFGSLTSESDRLISDLRRITERLFGVLASSDPEIVERVCRLQEIGAEAAHLNRELRGFRLSQLREALIS